MDAVHVIEDVPIRAETAPHYGQFVEVRLTSKTNLTALADDIDGIYVDADFCPIRDTIGVIAFGPFSKEGDDLSVPSATPALSPNADGKFEYRIYVPIAYRAKQVTRPGRTQLPTYDLRETDRDLCLRLFAPGYNVIASRSQTVRIPSKAISTAMSRASLP